MWNPILTAFTGWLRQVLSLVVAIAVIGALFWLLWPREAPRPLPVTVHATIQQANALVVSNIYYDVKYETDHNREGVKQRFKVFVIAPVTAQVTIDLLDQPLFISRNGSKLTVISPPPALDKKNIAISLNETRAFALDKNFWDYVFTNEKRVLYELSLTAQEPALQQAEKIFNENKKQFEQSAKQALIDLLMNVTEGTGTAVGEIVVQFRELTPAEKTQFFSDYPDERKELFKPADNTPQVSSLFDLFSQRRP